jgi:hypothetical protein
LTIDDIKNYDDLVDLIYDNEEHIEHNYQSHNDQILIHKPLLNKITQQLKNPEFKSINKLKLIRLLIRDVLELDEDDLIILKKEHIFIKMYDDDKRNKVSEDEQNTKVNRFNGIDEKSLSSFYDEYFSKDDIDAMFEEIALNFVKKYFVETIISNEKYEKDGFSLIQQLIIKDMEIEFESSVEFNKGFSGFILRKHFKLMFNYIAQFLLEEIVESNRDVMEFLKYYSLDIIVVNGKRYKVPQLVAENGLKWHAISMLSTAKTYIKAQHFISQKEDSLEELNSEIKSLFVNKKSPIAHNDYIISKQMILETKFEQNRLSLEKAHDYIDICKTDQEKNKVREEIAAIKEDRAKLKLLKIDLQKQRVKQQVITRYNQLIQKVDLIQREIHSKQKVIKQNKPSYESMKSAIVKAITSKKEPI